MQCFFYYNFELNDSLLRFKMGFSKNIRSFDLGSNIFDMARYENLRLATSEPDSPARIIFYRD